MLESVKSKINENRQLIGAASPALTVAALLMATDLGFAASGLIALAGLAQFLSQITDEKENKVLLYSGLIVMSSFLLKNLFGSEVQVAALTLSISMIIYAANKKV